MPNELKIVIDADVQKAITGVQNLSRVIAGDFAKATQAAAASSTKLSNEVAASVQKINTSLSQLKITSLDVSVNTSSVDASIKSIQSKFAALVDPQLNVLANTAQAEAKIKELLADLSALKGSEIFIRANDAQALASINKIEAELNTLVDKQIRLNVNTAEATQKLNLLEKELLDLQKLSVAPNISSTQLSVFQANIERIKAEIASLKSQGVVIPIQVNTAAAQANLNTLSETIETLRAKAEARKSFIAVETDINKIVAYNKEIQSLEARVRQLQNIGKKGFEIFVVPNQTIRSVKSLRDSVAAFGGGVRTFIPPAIAGFNKLSGSIPPVITQLKLLEKQAATSGAATTNAFSRAFGGLRSLAALIPGIGLGGIIGLAATAVNSLTEGFFEAAFGASKLDKAIDAAGESINKESLSVITMVRALQSGTLSSTEFKKVKAELIAQAPEFQKSFDGDKIKIDASEAALKEYVKQLVTTVKVTAALTLINDTLAKSLAVIAKGGEVSFGKVLLESVKSVFGANGLGNIAQEGVDSFNKALDQFKPENITKLIDDTFNKLGITFKDFAGTVDDKALKAALDKQKAAFDKFVTETISKAKQFTKEFGESFVVPNLEETFFKTKQQVFKESLKLLSDVKAFLGGKQDALKIKLPVLVTTETKVNADDLKKFLTGDILQDQIRTTKITIPVVTDLDIQLAESLAKEFEPTKDLIDNFFKGISLERNIPIEVIPDFSLNKSSLELIDKKLDLKKQFEILGDIGVNAFNKIDFSNINKGIEEATKRLVGMMTVATTLNQVIGQGLSNAFDQMFDAVLEGKNVFKALGEAVQSLVIETIKAIAKMLILKFVTNLIFPGSGGLPIPRIAGISRGRVGGEANFGFGGISGSRVFNNVLTVNVVGQVSGDVIRLAGQRAANSSGRFG